MVIVLGAFHQGAHCDSEDFGCIKPGLSQTRAEHGAEQVWNSSLIGSHRHHPIAHCFDDCERLPLVRIAYRKKQEMSILKDLLLCRSGNRANHNDRALLNLFPKLPLENIAIFSIAPGSSTSELYGPSGTS